ncbi:MAG TPA: iron-containing alcohol dehydrogenase [Bryobacteraceae bacterium]|nr:iron-containing alcohol dehydrogenase [Bryobacteraceae bacterium]
MQFEFATATRIVFGRGSSKTINATAATFGKRPFFVTGSRGSGFVVRGEPTVEVVRTGVEAFHAAGSDVVIAIGGGSVIDAAKAIAALATNPGDPLNYLEVVGRNQPIVNSPAPLIAVPTTAGTGAEVTRNAVLGVPEHRVKASLRSLMMLPRVAIIDPDLTFELPPEVTASTGMDALTQCIEPYVSGKANALTDLYCLEGMRRAARSLRSAFRDGGDVDARTDMAYASLLGGLALANAGLGVVHGFAAPIGGMFEAPHGAICAALLPHGVAANLKALRARAPQHDALARYDMVAQVLTGLPGATADDAVSWLRDLGQDLGIRRLASYGIAPEHYGGIAEKAAKASSMKANPIALSDEELRETLSRAC